MSNDRGYTCFLSSDSDSSVGSDFPSPPKKKAARQPRKDIMKQCDANKENNDPRQNKNKATKPPRQGDSFGQGNNHRRAGRMRSASPPGKPMVLSRRLSYRINNGSPYTPIVASKLYFSPVPISSGAHGKPTGGRANRHGQSSLEKINKPTKKSASNGRSSSKRNSV